MIIIFSCIAFAMVLSLLGYYSATHPYKYLSQLSPNDFGIKFEPVSFITKDKVKIKAWFIPSVKPNAKTIILLHGYPADKGDLLDSRLFLHPTYNLFLLDFRYMGESEGNYTTIGKDEILDLLAAIDYLQTRNISTVGVWGLSLGASVALMTAANAPQIKAIVAESPYARLDWMADEYYRIPIFNYLLGSLTRLWGMLFLHYDIKQVNPANDAKYLTIPIFLIHSKNDQVISFRHALLLQNMLKQNKHAQFLFNEKNKHGEIDLNEKQLIKRFFDENL